MPYLPNLGRPQGMPPRMGVMNPTDPNMNLVVTLTVCPALQYRTGPRMTSRDGHWMICWDIGVTGTGHTAQRRCHIVQDPGVPHLTNWGVMTDAVTPREQTSKVAIPLKVMTLAQRQALEKIANNAPVRVPDGKWNCQDWCLEVLQQAVKQGLLSASEVKAATGEAWNVQAIHA